jgi:hypothetical protein
MIERGANLPRHKKLFLDISTGKHEVKSGKLNKYDYNLCLNSLLINESEGARASWPADNLIF